VKPTTPLPWTLANGHFQHITGDDAAYIVHACNAYPKLVTLVKKANGERRSIFRFVPEPRGCMGTRISSEGVTHGRDRGLPKETQ
jgi:hypothetical protein